MNGNVTLSVVVPVYNSAPTLPQLTRRIEEALAPGGRIFETILVDDGSHDSSWEAIESLAADDPRIVGLRLMRNFGQHNALLAGIRQARGAVIVTLDDDLQNPPEEIPKLLARLEQGTDVVYGTPYARAHSRFRNTFSWLTMLALRKAMGAEVAGKVSPFRAFRSDLRRAFEHYRSAYVSIDVLLTWGTSRFAAVEVEHHARAEGRSNYDILRLIAHAMTMMTGFSTLPLRLASITGFLFTLFGGAVLAWVLIVYLAYGRVVPGFAFLAATTAIFSGAQLFALGIIGEYLARIHVRSLGRVPYVIDGRTPADQQANAQTASITRA
jgi:glycosyltransferase involved in cell wall biosynthesis